jgi:hypothetical protein
MRGDQEKNMSHDVHGSPADLEDAFTDAQWQGFRAEDLRAGSAVVMLMLSIFGIGVILYSIVAITL